MSKLVLSEIENHQSIAVGCEARISSEKYKEIYFHYYMPLSRDNVIREFYDLALQWKNDTKYLSSISEICMHPAYQKIIGMGEKALSLIFQDLSENPSHWFWALNSITGADPIQPNQRGKIKDMTRSWLNWGKEKGYIK